MTEVSPQTIYLKDYKPFGYDIDAVHLTFVLAPTATRVNYLRGTDPSRWVHNARTFQRVRYTDVYPLHRLGRFTTGLVLFARTHAAAAALGLAWRTHAVTKDYRALVDGNPSWDTCQITHAIGTVPHPTLGTVHAARDDGRASHSVATVVERRAGDTLVDVRITTGRPHQIRIHLAAIGHPLAGDPLYAPGGRPRAVAPGLPGDGGYLLHAHRLRVAHPCGTGTLSLEAQPPAALTVSGTGPR